MQKEESSLDKNEPRACYNGVRAPVAQLDRASGYEPEGRVFESLRAHHKIKKQPFTETRCWLEPGDLIFWSLRRRSGPVMVKHVTGNT
jgi:hypothetical protein